MRKTKYTKERLQPIVESNVSLAGVIKELGLKLTGSNYTHIALRIKQADLDTSHFLGQAANRGKSHKGGTKRKTWEEVLVSENSECREKAFRLRRALVESGREYKCEECEINEWLGKEIKLQVDHKNGNWSDNRKENLRFLCPNCHSQTENHSGSKGFTDLFTDAKSHREQRLRKKK